MNDMFLRSSKQSVTFEEVRILAGKLRAVYSGISLLGIRFPTTDDTAIAMAKLI